MNPIEIVKEKSKIKKFNPVQNLALENGLLNNINLVVSSPTASGKTIIAELAIINNWVNKRGKSIYIVPLRALAYEKYDEFKEKYSKLGLKIGVSTGDLDSTSDYLENKDLIILTSEKLDSLMRHRADWLSLISLVIADENHLLTEQSRGPTLEIVITLLKENLTPQIIALSATISNADEIAEWLNANLVVSDYRPVPLEKGIFSSGKLILEDKTENVEEDLISFIKKVVRGNKQVLIFLSSRRNTESLAEKLLGEFPLVESDLPNKVLKILENPTKQCKKEYECLRHGIAFHHAGLLNRQRSLIEKGFREGKIKIICATTTLAAGLNLPAFMVVIKDTKRYCGGYSQYLPNFEIQQMLGRAGRPKYDKAGLGILVAKNFGEVEELRRIYLEGEIEPITSKLAIEPVLRMHILSLIASDFVHSADSLLRFFHRTFFGYTYGTSYQLKEKLEDILIQLNDFSFIDLKKFRATRIGKRVSELYLDPLSAYRIIQAIEKASVKTEDIFWLQTICYCSELYPLLKVKNKEVPDIDEFIAKNEEKFLVELPNSWDFEYNFFLDSIKTSYLLGDWIEEKTEETILEKYGITPGELYIKKTNSEWLLYGAQEFAKLKGNRKVAKELRKLEIRMKNGIKEELLDLIKIKGVGRVRARRLYSFGIKRVSDIKKFNIGDVEKLIGKKVLSNLVE
jgi:helicase